MQYGKWLDQYINTIRFCGEAGSTSSKGTVTLDAGNYFAIIMGENVTGKYSIGAIIKIGGNRVYSESKKRTDDNTLYMIDRYDFTLTEKTEVEVTCYGHYYNSSYGASTRVQIYPASKKQDTVNKISYIRYQTNGTSDTTTTTSVYLPAAGYKIQLYPFTSGSTVSAWWSKIYTWKKDTGTAGITGNSNGIYTSTKPGWVTFNSTTGNNGTSGVMRYVVTNPNGSECTLVDNSYWTLSGYRSDLGDVFHTEMGY